MTSTSFQLAPIELITRSLARGAAILAVAGVAACSTAPDWAKPGFIYGDDAEAASQRAAAESDFPELSSVPEKPETPALARELEAQREGLAADRAQARYTDEVLRGGTEAPAPAPRPAPVATAIEPVSSSTVDVPVVAPVASAPAAPVAPEVPVAVATPVETQAPQAPVVRTPERAPVTTASRRPAVPPLAKTAPVSAPEAPARAVSPAPAAPPAPAPAAVAASAPAPVPASTGYSRQVFEASSAPALAPEALEAAGPTVGSRIGVSQTTVIGDADPEDPVQVNMDALLGTPGPGAALQAPESTSVATVSPEFANQGGPGNIPPYIVRFGYGSTSLSAEDRELVRQAADVALAHGSRVRVVGHASSKTGDLDLSSHLMANFSVSLDRATAVANELIGAGVDPSLVLVEAKSDTVPVYYESMPAGEAGNRRAEIFIE